MADFVPEFCSDIADGIYCWYLPTYDSKQQKYTVRHYKSGPSKGTGGSIKIFKLKKYGGSKKKAFEKACEFFKKTYGFECRVPMNNTVIDVDYVEYMKNVNKSDNVY